MNKIEEEIKKTDSEIDRFVYTIYGITEEEKKIIEESRNLEFVTFVSQAL